MFFIVNFEHHYNNDEEWYWDCKALIKTSDTSKIEACLKDKYPNGYIKIISISNFDLKDGEVFDITPNCGAIG